MKKYIYEDNLTSEIIKDLKPNRRTVRAIIKKEDKYSVTFMQGGDVFIFIGGGINEDEDIIDALKREALEESGIEVEPVKHICTIQNYSKRKDSIEYWHSDYYLCKVISEGHELSLEDYEKENGIEIRWYTKEEMIKQLRDYPTSHSFGRSVQNRELLAFKSLFE